MKLQLNNIIEVLKMNTKNVKELNQQARKLITLFITMI